MDANQKRTKHFMALMQAYLNGETIEVKPRHADKALWRITEEPEWDFHQCSYRIQKRSLFICDEEMKALEIRIKAIEDWISYYSNLVSNDGR